MSNDENKGQDKPLFLKAQDPSTWEKPEETSWGDHFLQPNRALSPRHKRLALLLYEGKRTSEIARELEYTQARVSVLKSNSKILAEVERLRELAFDKTVDERMQDLGPMAMDALEELLNDPSVPASKKESVARWVVEMKMGKANQKLDVSGEVNLGLFMDKLDKLPRARNVTPAQLEGGESPEEPVIIDAHAEWLDKNL